MFHLLRFNGVNGNAVTASWSAWGAYAVGPNGAAASGAFQLIAGAFALDDVASAKSSVLGQFHLAMEQYLLGSGSWGAFPSLFFNVRVKY